MKKRPSGPGFKSFYENLSKSIEIKTGSFIEGDVFMKLVFCVKKNKLLRKNRQQTDSFVWLKCFEICTQL